MANQNEPNEPQKNPLPGRFDPIEPVEHPPATSDGIEVEVAGWFEPRVRVSVLGTRIVLRLTDARQPGLSAVIYISESVVSHWDRFAALRTVEGE